MLFGSLSTSKLVWFGQDAQPRKLSAAGSVLSWEAPCTALERPLQYTILLRDTVTGKETYASLAPTKDVSLRYTVENLQVPYRTLRVCTATGTAFTSMEKMYNSHVYVHCMIVQLL
jgi:hypothetical protein